MTGSDVVLDTWAWWEVFHDTRAGKLIARRFLDTKDLRVHTSVISVGELAAKLSSLGADAEIDRMELAVRSHRRVHDVTLVIAVMAGRLRDYLQRTQRDASLADGIFLATARNEGARLVSADPAFRDLPELIRMETVDR